MDGFTLKEMMITQKASIDLLHEKIDAVHTQAQLTNGRLNRLEPQVEENKKQIQRNGFTIAKWSGALAVVMIAIQYFL
jgi:hypothetical protein